MQHGLETHYVASIVALSIFVAIFGSFVALDVTGSLAKADGWAKGAWLSAGAVAMGSGIWSMHFIGMLAFQMREMPMAYDVGLMALSIAVAVAASAFALEIMIRTSVSRPGVLASGVAMAAAIAGMHYIGMYSMRMPAMIEWNYGLVALSLMIALLASLAAIKLAIALPTSSHPLLFQTSASVLMGVAIAGMHYVGMEAATFHATDSELDTSGMIIADKQLMLIVAVSTFVILVLALMSSVTDRAFTRRRLREEENARRAAEAQEANALKTRFLANMSHEIRTPLGAIMGFTELLLENKLNEKEKRAYLEIIYRSARSLLHLVDDILDLSKIEMDKLEVEQTPFELRPFIEEILTLLNIKASVKGLTIEFHGDRHVSPWISTDPARLRQILINIIGNAIKFTDRGRIELRMSLDGQFLVFEIEDSGIGIDPGQRENLFQPFSQADNSTTRRYGGTGLGLDISRRLARALGGTVELLSSIPNRGSTFQVRIEYRIAQVPGSFFCLPSVQ